MIIIDKDKKLDLRWFEWASASACQWIPITKLSFNLYSKSCPLNVVVAFRANWIESIDEIGLILIWKTRQNIFFEKMNFVFFFILKPSRLFLF